jgi:hypothetical protein
MEQIHYFQKIRLSEDQVTHAHGGADKELVEKVEYTDVWSKVKEAARTTIGREGPGAYPSDQWKKTALLAEHSIIRKIRFKWVWTKLKSWISVHFVRHKIGVEHWVSTQRTDRTGVDRNRLPQDTLVNHEVEANAQGLSRFQETPVFSADPETRQLGAKLKRRCGWLTRLSRPSWFVNVCNAAFALNSIVADT